MADSDNTMTLPLVTRRRILAGVTIAVAGIERQAFAEGDSKMDPSADPALAAWCKWLAVHQQTERLCRQQQRLERRLVETVGFPCATIRLRDGESVTLHSFEALHEKLGLGQEAAPMRAKAEADLSAHQARWEAADEEVGYSAALRAEIDAANRAEDLLEELSATPATSLIGVAAKLDAVLREGEEGHGEFPWQQIRSAFEDIMRIGRQRESTGTLSDVPSGQ